MTASRTIAIASLTSAVPQAIVALDSAGQPVIRPAVAVLLQVDGEGVGLPVLGFADGHGDVLPAESFPHASNVITAPADASLPGVGEATALADAVMPKLLIRPRTNAGLARSLGRELVEVTAALVVLQKLGLVHHDGDVWATMPTARAARLEPTPAPEPKPAPRRTPPRDAVDRIWKD